MTSGGARLRAAFLFYAAIQFVVLTTIAMRLYAGGTFRNRAHAGYDFFGNFFSDLGATRGWSGRPNEVSEILFGIALGSLGIAFVAFAGAWRAFAFERGRARALGITSQLFGTLSGLAFLGVAVTPVNRALDLHNTFVIAAFGLLLVYAWALTILWWKNGCGRVELAACIAYLVCVAGYVASVVIALRMGGFFNPRGFELMVVGQKLIAYVSMAYIMFLTGRVLASPRAG